MKKILLILIPFIVLLYSCDSDVEPEVVKFSKHKYDAKDAVNIGAAINSELKQFYFSNDQFLDTIEYVEAYDYVSKVLKTLATSSNVSKRSLFDWSITIIINEEDLEMYSIPGGHLFITTGLLKYISSESQLLMMLAHEIYYPDNLILQSKLRTQFGGVALGDVISQSEDHQALEMGIYLKDIILDTEEVSNADEYAVNLVCPFRYDSQSLQEVLSGSNNGQLKWLTNRPYTSDRVSNLISKSILCGSEDRQFPERYNLFKNVYLP